MNFHNICLLVNEGLVHEVDPHDFWGNEMMGECPSWFYGICRYEHFPDKIDLRCVNCPNSHD